MNSLISGLSQLLTPSEAPPEETEDGLSALDQAMQDAIEKRASEPDVATGDAGENAPRVTAVQPKAGVFGRRVASDD